MVGKLQYIYRPGGVKYGVSVYVVGEEFLCGDGGHGDEGVGGVMGDTIQINESDRVT